MNLDSFTGPGSTPSRRRFWDKVTQAVNASQKVAGRNVSVSEHQGMGTLINVIRGRGVTPPGCPCIVFTDVEFCCSSDDPSTGYFEDAGTHPCDFLNDKPFCLSPVTNDLCTYCTNDDPCNGGTTSGGLNIWFGNCDTHEDFFSSNIFLNTVFIDGLWHIFAYVASSPFFGTFFYGTTTDLSIPAENQITSCMDAPTIDNAATDCIFGEPLTSIPVVAFGGTAFMSSCPPTGACCYSGGCLVTTECYCTEILSGTYQGDDTVCDPDPC